MIELIGNLLKRKLSSTKLTLICCQNGLSVSVKYLINNTKFYDGSMSLRIFFFKFTFFFLVLRLNQILFHCHSSNANKISVWFAQKYYLIVYLCVLCFNCVMFLAGSSRDSSQACCLVLVQLRFEGNVWLFYYNYSCMNKQSNS